MSVLGNEGWPQLLSDNGSSCCVTNSASERSACHCELLWCCLPVIHVCMYMTYDVIHLRAGLSLGNNKVGLWLYANMNGQQAKIPQGNAHARSG